MPGDPFDCVSCDLSTNPWISTLDARGERVALCLPAVLARLGGGEELEFPALQGHQQQAWYAFLVQLGALALHRSGGRPEQDEEGWRSDLLALASSPAAWHLVSDDLSQPAFFQPPVPEGDLAAYKRSSRSPEILDVLIAAKNHDIKADRFTAEASTELWAYALVTLQTTEGFLGRGNYGIARMNGGFSSRPHVGFAPGLGWSARLRRDLALLLESREDLVLDHGFSEKGLALLWELPWGGSKEEALDLRALDPYFLEICRRVRLTRVSGHIVARVANTDAPRVDAKERLGVLGDPFTPIAVPAKDRPPTALTVGDGGFHYRLVANLLFPAHADSGLSYVTPALEPRSGDQLAVLRVLVRGQGKTGGLHERQIPIPREVMRKFGQVATRTQMGVECQARIQKVREVQKRLLKRALLTLAQDRVGRTSGGGIQWKDERANPWLDRFEARVDRVFFPQLFADLAEGCPGEELLARWERCLYELAGDILDNAQQTLAPAGVHRFRAIARARSLFEGLARTQVLPHAFEPDPENLAEPPPVRAAAPPFQPSKEGTPS